MVQDSGPQDVQNQTDAVDIDELEVEILILAKSAKALQATSTFLTRRGWPTTVMTNLSKGVEYIAERRPDFVLISLNHPSPAVFKLPDLITQTFNLVSIGFMESSDSMSTQKLNQTKLRYKIFGSPSGPNFQRTIRRILAEKFNVKIDDRGPVEEAKPEKQAHGSVTVRGPKKASDAGAPAAGTGASDGPQVLHGNKAEASGGVYVQKSSAANEQDYGSMGAAVVGGSQGPAGVIIQQGSAGVDINGEFSPDDLAKELALVDSNSRAPGASANIASQVQQTSGESSVMESALDGASIDPARTSGKPRKRLKQLTGMDPLGAVAGNLLFGKDMDPNHPAPTPVEAPAADLVGMLKKSLFGEDGIDSSETTGQSVLEKAVESGLRQSFKGNPDLPPISLNRVSRAAVFPVDSGSMPGYLVLALETNQANDPIQFLKDCEQFLLKAFQSLGVPGKLEPGFWLNLSEVPFDLWAGHSSTFSFKMDHNGAEVGVAFFGTETPLPKARPEAETGMYTLEIDSISTEHPINFKAYLHLQKNQKYYLYLRNGRRLQPEQKERLKQKQVKDIFMKSVDIENARMFFASVFLNASIRSSKAAA